MAWTSLYARAVCYSRVAHACIDTYLRRTVGLAHCGARGRRNGLAMALARASGLSLNIASLAWEVVEAHPKAQTPEAGLGAARG